MMKLGYFGEAEKKLVRFAGEETTPTPKDDEVVVFKSFFRAGLRFPLNEMIGEVLDNFEIYLHQLTPNAIVRLSIFIWPFEAKGWTQRPKHSAGCMSCTIKRRLEQTGCTKILAAIISRIAKIRRLRSSAIIPSGQSAGRVNVLYQGRWEEEGETEDDGHVTAGFKLRNDQTFVQHEARVNMPTGQSGSWTNQHQESSARIPGQQDISNVEWLEYAEAKRNKEEEWTCSIALSL
jgi:hypothetical protein